MRVTYYDKDGKVTETKDFGDKASDVVLNYDDTKLFFQIPESIIKSARSKKDKLERLYLLEQLRFLIEYDYELYTKSELCDKQDVEMSCYLRDIGCKDIEGMKPTQSDNDSNYQPNPVFAEMRDRLFRHATNLSDIRHRLINTTKRNNIQYSRIVRDPLSKDSCYNQVYLYSDELTPEVCYLLSLLAPLGDISEKQIYEESLFKDNKFLLSIARALYRTNGINRSVLYNLLRLFMPTTYKTTQLQGVLGFSTSTIAQEGDSFEIHSIDELGDEIESYSFKKSDLVKLFSISATDKPLLEEIVNKFRDEFDRYGERQQDTVEKEFKREFITNSSEITPNDWTRLLDKWYKELQSKYETNCDEEHLYVSPYCLYGIVLHYEDPEEMLCITEPLTRDVIFCYAKNRNIKRIPMYKVMFSLNYIKAKAANLEYNLSKSSEPKHEIDKEHSIPVDPEQDKKYSEAIKRAISFIEPIFKSNNRTSIISEQDLRKLFVDILNIDEVKRCICKKPYKKFDSFNIRMVYNIIGLLIDAGYFLKDAAKGLADEIEEYHKANGENLPRLRENINNYAKGYDSPYGYINRNGLFDLILNFLGDKKSKKVSAAITAKELNKKQR